MKSSASAAPISSMSSEGCLKDTSSLSWRNSSMAMVSGCWDLVWTCGPGMPRASLRPRVEVYSLIWRALLALATARPERESTLSRSSSILRSCSIFASIYYRLHLLDHVLAGLLPVLVYDLMVELVPGRDLAYGGRQPVLQGLFCFGSPSCEPAAGLLQRGRADKDHHGIRTF